MATVREIILNKTKNSHCHAVLLYRATPPCPSYPPRSSPCPRQATESESPAKETHNGINTHYTNPTHTPHLCYAYTIRKPHLHYTYTTLLLHIPYTYTTLALYIHHTFTTHTLYIHHTCTIHTPHFYYTYPTHSPHLCYRNIIQGLKSLRTLSPNDNYFLALSQWLACI